MSGNANRAEVFMKAFDSLSKAEKIVVASRLLDDPEFREEVLDIGHIRECDTETTHALEVRLEERATHEG